MKNRIFNIFDIIKTYRWQSIFFVYLKKILIFISVPMIIMTSLLSFYIKKNNEYNYQTNFNEVFYKINSQINSMFSEFSNYYDLLNTNEVILFTDSSLTGFIDANAKNTKTLLKNMNMMKQTAKFISNISVYRFTDDYILSTNGGGYLSAHYNTAWYDTYKKTRDNYILYHYRSPHPSVSSSLTVAKGIYSKNNLVGYIIFEVNDYVLNNLITFTYNQETISVLSDTSGNILYSTDFNLIEKTTESIKDKRDLKTENGISYMFSTFSSQHSGASDYFFIFITVGTMILSLFIAVVISFYIAFQFYKSIYSLYKTFSSADVYSEKANDEIDQIMSSILKIVDKNEQFEKEINEKVISLRKAQTIALQTQLNPHFLFNTLNMINLMAIRMTKNDNEVSKTITLLSDLLRESLCTQEYTASLNTELLYVSKFISIERMKHNNNFSVVYDISEETKNCKVVKFMLQPIIENAFEHGINHIKSDKKLIKIEAQKIEDTLVVSIKNNGKSLSEETLEKLNTILKTDIIPENKHIGMFNVNSRIKIFFGSQYGCSIFCKDEETTVTLTLPFENL